MATVTLRPNGDNGVGSGWANEVAATTNLYLSIDEVDVFTPNTSDYAGSGTSNSVYWITFDDVPVNLDAVSECVIRLVVARTSSKGDYHYIGSCQLFKADKTTALDVNLTGLASSTTPTLNSYTRNATLTATDKTSWDGVTLAVRINNASGGGSGRLYTAQLDLTYTETAGGPDEEYTMSGGFVLGGTSTASTGSSLRVNLGAFWNLNETSGNRADSSFNNNTLTDTNTVSYSTGIKSNGASFVSANNEHLSIADNSSLTLGSTDFSISLWVKFDALTNNGANDYIGIVSKGSGGAAYSFSIQYRPATHQLQIQIYNGGTTYTLWASSFGTMTTGVWYHIVATYKDSNKATTLSVNGTENTGTSTVALIDSSYGFSLGRAYYNNTYNSSCTIDSVGCWKKVLSSSEKTVLYSSGQGQEFPFESNSFSYSPSNGVVLGGTATCIPKYNYSNLFSGGVVLGGESNFRLRCNFAASGSLTLSGAAVCSYSGNNDGSSLDLNPMDYEYFKSSPLFLRQNALHALKSYKLARYNLDRPNALDRIRKR